MSTGVQSSIVANGKRLICQVYGGVVSNANKPLEIVIIVKRATTRAINRRWFRVFPYDKRRGELLDPA